MKELYEQLSGRWLIQATNFPMWLSEKRRKPSITYGLLAVEPLTLSDRVEYRNAKGKRKIIKGVDTAIEYGQSFKWRGEGILALLSSRWDIVAIEDNILVIRFEKSLVTPGGVDVLVREHTAVCDLKLELRESLDTYGLSIEEFRSLSWL
ncbi:hypothetical protein I6N96_08175 [Enterococcus sp. BWM-S5]|uniref:Lipocalin/cytosolic fatty-acid binding domain-containing protein n=1 Tax=Enterococcus larvae TaxID=2794352 RepID=A0ABS4CI04_9ENTE|nr:hypothetical protein [Enterococcus larvae]MBP1046259.1 hypothetical protein [Enterococcus larvae]